MQRDSTTLPILPLAALAIYPEDTGTDRPRDPKVLSYAAMARISLALALMLVVHASTHSRPSPGLAYGEPPATLLVAILLFVAGVMRLQKSKRLLRALKPN
jgi:hypothetical protein